MNKAGKSEDRTDTVKRKTSPETCRDNDSEVKEERADPSKWIHVNKIADRKPDPDLFYATVYEYSGEQKDSFLHLAAAGSPTIDIPMKIQFQPDRYTLILYVRRGSVRITVPGSGGHTIPEGHYQILPADSKGNPKGFTFLASLLPLSLSVLFIEGEPMRLYQSHLSAAGRPLPADPLEENILEKLLAFSCPSVNSAALYRMNALLTILFTKAVTAGILDPDSVSTIKPSNVSSSMASSPSPDSDTGNRAIPSYLVSMHERIHLQYREPFSLSQCEHTYEISRYRLCREYSSTYGISPLQDLNQTRIHRARELLLSPRIQVQEVSSLVGFENVNHFIHLFCRQTGMTPGEYQKKVLQGNR